MKNKAIIRLTVSTQGFIRAYQGDTNFYHLFQKGKHIAENVHISDKISLMTLLDNARIGKKDKSLNYLRFMNDDGLFVGFNLGNANLGVHGITFNCHLADETQFNAVETQKSTPQEGNQTSYDALPPLSIAAHEMREPLNAIIGFTDFLIQEFAGKFKNEKQLECAKNIKESGIHLLDIIKTYLERQENEISASFEDVDSTIKTAIAMTTHVTNTRQIIFAPNAQEKYFSVLKPVQLKQILVNLITNAAKYSHHDSIITIQRRILKNNNLLLTVSDTGSGIAAEEIADIRQPFKRSAHAISSGVQGEGIGLSLVFQIVEAAKGIVSISSKKNSGTTISITVPLGHTPQLRNAAVPQSNDCDSLQCVTMQNHSHSAQLLEKYIGDDKNKEKIDKTA